MRPKLCSVVVLGALLTLPAAVFADTVGFTGGNGSTGTGSVSYTPGMGNNFSVTGAQIDTLSINGASYSITGGLMSLVSGPTISINPGTCVGGGCYATFGSGGSLSVTGATLGLGLGSTLLSASYLTNGWLSFSGFGNGVYSALLDPASLSLNTAIMNLLGSPNILSGSNTVINLNIKFSSGTYSGTNAVTNSGITISTIPEPGTISLLGAGLIALVGFRKKVLTASV